MVHIHLIVIIFFFSLAVGFPSPVALSWSHRSLLSSGVLSCPNHSAWAGLWIWKKNPSSSSEPSQFAPNNSILQKCMQCLRCGRTVGEELSISRLRLWSELAVRKFLLSAGASQLWILSAHLPHPSFNSSGLLSTLLRQYSKRPAGSQAVVVCVFMYV